MQQLIGEPPGRITPVDETVNVFEVETTAQRKLNSLTFAQITGSDRRVFDRMTFRPRMMIDTTKLDLTLNLFGATMLTPIIAGPVSLQKRFHPEGEVASARGLSAAKVLMVVSDNSSFPLDQIAPEAKAGFWYQVSNDGPDTKVESQKERIRSAVAAGCKAVCLTLSSSGTDWKSIDALRQGLTVPLVLKGIMNADDAKDAVSHSVQGVVVSNYVAAPTAAMASSMEVLPGIVDAVGGKIPVLIDGSFRRGSDFLMALALGARGVLAARPVAWGLAGYGAPGVQKVFELMQSELARDMAMCGKVNLAAVDRSMVKVHRW